MSEPVYFQWQNDILLKTIYPLRAMKLRDFLVFFREVEVWAEYQAKPEASLVGEQNEYVQAQKQAILEMKDLFAALKDYFTHSVEEPLYAARLRRSFKDWVDVAALRKQTSDPVETQEVYAKVINLHNTCRDYWKMLNGNLRKEKIFTAQRVSEWEDLYRDVFRKSQRAHVLEEKKNRYEDALTMAKMELDYLHHLLSFYNKVDGRRADLIKPREKNQAQKTKLETEMVPLLRSVQSQQAKIDELGDLIRRIGVIRLDPNPDKLGRLKAHFSASSLADSFRKSWTGTDLTWLDKFGRIWLLLRTMTNAKDRQVKLNLIKTEIVDLNRLQAEVERRLAELQANLAKIDPNDPAMAANFRATRDALERLKNFDENAVKAELDLLKNFRVVLEFMTDDLGNPKPAQQIDRTLLELQNTLRGFQDVLDGEHGDAVKLRNKQAELAPVTDFLEKSRDENLLNFISDNPIDPKKVTRQDLARARIEKYSLELADCDLPALLEAVVAKFLAAPEEYPLWLQYMVIHFSGMRYASAHGSWADPKDLLTNLGTSVIADFFRADDDDDFIAAQCEEKIATYTDWKTAIAEPGRRLPQMVEVMNPSAKCLEPRLKWQEKIQDHLQGLGSQVPYQRRKALLDLRIDESTYEVESLSAQETLDTLKVMRDFLSMPDWMWDEIVKLTELRLTEVTKDDWEKPIQLTPEIQKSEAFKKYWEVMSQWKKNNLTSWREAHHDTEQLIVTRAVCNEVAEHIQHLRGHRGGAGLTSKPDWYQREVNRFGKPAHSQQDEHHPYFIKPKIPEDFKSDFQVGASILWLRFVNQFPDEWRIAKPMATRDGDRLVPGAYINRKSGDPSVWSYDESGAIHRRRKEPRQEQWLRWMHEATVAKVADTADGRTVLTFETALPHEDRRLSTIGVFKRFVPDLLSDFGEDGYNASFIGFVPEGVVSAEDVDEFTEDPDKFMENQKNFVENLEEMLDWNKILRRQVMTPAQLEAYQEKYIRSKLPAAPPKIPPGEAEPAALEVTHPPITNVLNRSAPLRAWRVKWDWEGTTDFGTSFRDVAPDPCVFRCGDLENNKNGHYVDLTKEWQLFWFELCCKVAFGRYSDGLGRKRIWMANRWEALGGNYTAFTNQHGIDVSKNFVLGERLEKGVDLPKIYTLVCGGATLTGEVVENSKGVKMLKVDHFNGNLPPPQVDSIDPYADPRIFFANIITKKEVKETKDTKHGYRVVRFPQFRGKQAPVPLIANRDIYYPLSDLEEITTGVKAPSYYP